MPAHRSVGVMRVLGSTWMVRCKWSCYPAVNTHGYARERAQGCLQTRPIAAGGKPQKRQLIHLAEAEELRKPHKQYTMDLTRMLVSSDRRQAAAAAPRTFDKVSPPESSREVTQSTTSVRDQTGIEQNWSLGSSQSINNIKPIAIIPILTSPAKILSLAGFTLS